MYWCKKVNADVSISKPLKYRYTYKSPFCENFHFKLRVSVNTPYYHTQNGFGYAVYTELIYRDLTYVKMGLQQPDTYEM